MEATAQIQLFNMRLRTDFEIVCIGQQKVETFKTLDLHALTSINYIALWRKPCRKPEINKKHLGFHFL